LEFVSQYDRFWFMKKFVLKSEMTPKGDQPAAIKALVAGLKKKKKLQTLLGGTGTGKSVTAETPVMVYRKDDDGRFYPMNCKIGKLIDGDLSSRASKVEKYQDTEILYDIDNGENYYVPSFNPKTKKTELKLVTALVRHHSPENLYCLRTSCGREATFTGDHNLYVLRDGELKLIETKDARASDYIPLPVEIESFAKQDDLEYISLARYIDRKMFVSARKPLLACASACGEAKVKDALSSSFPDASLKYWNIANNDERVSWTDFTGMKGEFDLLDCFDYEVDSRLGKTGFSEKFPLSEAFLELLGIYIAEGCHSDGYIVISAREDEFFQYVKGLLAQLGWKFSVRPNGDITIFSTLLADLFRNLGGKGSFGKKLPEFWPKLSLRQLACLLRGYFSGDGGVDGAAVTATTASKDLASDLLYALNRYGIWGRLKQKFKRATNSDHAGNYYQQITISGQSDLQKYVEEIGFLIERKEVALGQILGKKENTNVDLIPGLGPLFLAIRTKHGLTQRDLAALCGLGREMISSIELGKRNISRRACTKLFECLIGAYPDCELCLKVGQLLNLRWTLVESCEEMVSNEKYVYDFSVKDNETFLAGVGGMFVHNTFVMAKIVEELQRPTLVLAHNKTLAAQLCSEFQEFFPDNAISYFVSYYDYYQPEAYKPSTDTYIEKDASINEEIDKFRHAATANLLTRKDVLIVASVSCIYGLGSVEDYNALAQEIKVGDMIVRDRFLRQLTDLQYTRSNIEFKNGMFHVLGDVVEIFPRDRDTIFRIEFFGDEVEAISEADAFTGEVINELESVTIFPSKHAVTTQEKVEAAVVGIREDMDLRYQELLKQGRTLEAERIKTRTEYDLEILQETGYCNGIENYTRYLSGADPGQRPSTLMDYLPDDFLLFIDESHISVPQIGGMFNGNFSRKQTLIEHGFRMPSSHDNRPLRFDEFEGYMKNTVFVSATPGKYEKANTPKDAIVEQVVRPTGLLDPQIEVRPIKGQIESLLKEIAKRVEMGDRVLITTLTKRSAEDLTDYLADADIRVRYLHSDIDTIERIEILRDLRLGKFDVLVGINLLREGLDLPEVSLVAILDADKQGFLRSASALIQTIGRCARNVNGTVIMFADKMTDAMTAAIEETDRRREKQEEYNKKHGITPETIKKAIRDISHFGGKKKDKTASGRPLDLKKIPKDEAKRMIESLESKMDLAAMNMEFEKAAEIRDEIDDLREELGV
jgi:excinuclease ABC B subunit